MINEMPAKMRKTLAQDIPPSTKCYAFLKEGILTGYFRRGQHIVERDIIALLSVSRTPLREALRKLENETLIEHNRNKGCTIIGFSGRDIAEIYELRKVLECFMIQTAARSVTRAELLRLRDEIVSNKDRFDDEEDYWSFHIQMMKLTGHRWLNTILGQLEEYIERFHVLSFLRRGRKEQAYEDHLGIVDALLAGDAAKAESLLKDHLDKSYEALKDILSLV